MSEIFGLFAGFGFLMICGVIAFAGYQLVRILKPIADKEQKYELYEELVLDKVALKAGHDLPGELKKRELMNTKTFRKKLEEKLYDEMFEKVKK